MKASTEKLYRSNTDLPAPPSALHPSFSQWMLQQSFYHGNNKSQNDAVKTVAQLRSQRYYQIYVAREIIVTMMLQDNSHVAMGITLTSVFAGHS